MDAAGELKTALARLVRALLPEVTGMRGTVRARVVAVHAGAGAMSELDPRYSVDVQPLDRDGNPDAGLPELPDVPLSVLWAGPGRGVYCVPAVGAIVRLGFEYGDVNRPYIEGITGEGYDAPAYSQGQLVIRGSGATVTLNADGTIDVDGGKVRLCGGGSKVLTELTTCLVTGTPHVGGSSKVEAHA